MASGVISRPSRAGRLRPLACAGLMLACSANDAVSHRDSPPATARWSPSLGDAIDERERRRFLLCDAEGCETLLNLPDSCPVYESSTSPSAELAVVWYKCPRSSSAIEFFRLRDSQRVARIVPDAPLDDPALTGLSFRADVSWTSGDNLLITWGAGSGVAEAVLFGAAGVEAWLSAAAIFVSPERRTALGLLDPLATEGRVEVILFDLASGAQSTRTVRGISCVTHVSWADPITLECAEEGRHERVQLSRADSGEMR